MYTLISALTTRQLLMQQAPVLATALLIAELFYKFHSFTLECLAFLATWYTLDGFRKFLSDCISTRNYPK